MTLGTSTLLQQQVYVFN